MVSVSPLSTALGRFYMPRLDAPDIVLDEETICILLPRCSSGPAGRGQASRARTGDAAAVELFDLLAAGILLLTCQALERQGTLRDVTGHTVWYRLPTRGADGWPAHPDAQRLVLCCWI